MIKLKLNHQHMIEELNLAYYLEKINMGSVVFYMQDIFENTNPVLYTNT